MPQQPLFTMLPVIAADPALVQIPATDYERLYPYEHDVYGHWELGGNAASLTDKVNGRLLTQGGAAPAYSAGYLTVSQASGNGMASDLPDPVAGLSATICAVVRRNAVTAGLWLPFGNLSTTDGISPFANGGGNIMITGRGLTGLSSADTGKTWPASSWLFMALSMDFDSPTKAVRFLRGGQPIFEATPTGTYTPNTDGPVAIGGKYYSTALAADVDCAEFIIFDGSKSAADLSEIYQRSKVRAAKRGVTVV